MSLVLTIVNAWRPSFYRLQEVADFGTNPGALRMLTYLPDDLPTRPALVVVLHGATQSAANCDLGVGWSTLADQYGFALLMPEQSRQNNLTRSFNWFQPDDTRRGEGEAHSIMQMVERMVRDHNIDRSRIFISGLSAGGAMTLVMLATYPEVFAAGAVIAGLPYGGASPCLGQPRQQARPASRTVYCPRPGAYSGNDGLLFPGRRRGSVSIGARQ